MTRREDQIFRNATTIAETRMREARRAQSQEALRAFAKAVRGVEGFVRTMHSRARRAS